jgi:hypothetical protein
MKYRWKRDFIKIIELPQEKISYLCDVGVKRISSQVGVEDVVRIDTLTGGSNSANQPRRLQLHTPLGKKKDLYTKHTEIKLLKRKKNKKKLKKNQICLERDSKKQMSMNFKEFQT